MLCNIVQKYFIDVKCWDHWWRKLSIKLHKNKNLPKVLFAVKKKTQHRCESSTTFLLPPPIFIETTLCNTRQLILWAWTIDYLIYLPVFWSVLPSVAAMVRFWLLYNSDCQMVSPVLQQWYLPVNANLQVRSLPLSLMAAKADCPEGGSEDR